MRQLYRRATPTPARSSHLMSPARRGIIVALLLLLWSPSAVRADDRTIDGSGNNIANPAWGSVDVQLLRQATPAYGDAISTPAGSGLPSARAISNAVVAQTTSILNDRKLSDFVWQWGQFVDHDIDLTVGADPAEPFNISVPTGDPDFDPFNTGTQIIPLNRSAYDTSTGTGIGNPRQQINQITAYIDASNVYGSDQTRADALRTFSGGKLMTSPGNLLPFNTLGLPNANGGPVPDDQLYLAGDVRANEQIALTAMHTLFMREHNRLVDDLVVDNPGWTDEQLYQRARKIVGAEMQVITFGEFLPALLGPYAPNKHGKYDDSIDAGIKNEFSTGTYRFGHTMLSPQLLRVEDDGSMAPGGALPLADSFFNPTNLSSSDDLDHLLKGLASQKMQEVDTLLVDDVRNFLFGPPGSGGFDLAALNIQRGRDHGLADYNSTRVAYGLTALTDFDQITSDVSLQAALADLYDSVDDIDIWTGALAEDHLSGASVGPLVAASMVDQFERLRDGDRFWYKNDTDLTAHEIAHIHSTTLADVILRNTGITNIQNDVFFIRGQKNPHHFVVDESMGAIRGSVAAVPEPTTLMLFSIGVTALFATSRRRKVARPC